MRHALLRRLRVLILTGFWVQVSVVALAAQRPDTVVLQPLVVTATRLPIPADAVPATVTVLTGAQLRERGVRTLAEALRLTPAAMVVETGSFGGQTSLFLRGGESNFTKVLLDGVPLNQPGGAFDFADLTLDNVERIEIVRGPVSVLYGSDAVTGVVHVITRAGSGRARTELNMGGGTYGSITVGGALAGEAGPLRYAVSGSRLSTDGLYSFNSQYRRAAGAGRLQLAFDAATELSLTAAFADNLFHFPTEFDGTLADSNQLQARRGPTVALEVARRFGPRVDLRVVGGWAATETRGEDRQDGAADTAGYYESDSEDQLRRLTGGVRANIHFSPMAVLTGGVDLERETQHSTTELRGEFPTFADTSAFRRRNAATYGQLVTGLGRPLSITVGGRLESNERFGTHVTWRGGLAYRIDRATRVRASAGTAFKEPTFFENFARGFVLGNPDLDPERTRSWELGVERSIAQGRVVLSATWFDQRFRDLIDFTFTPPPPDTVNYFNIAAASARGLEVGVEATPRAGWHGAVHYTWLRARVIEAGFDSASTGAFAPGSPLLRRPTHTAGVSVTRSLGRLGQGGGQVTLSTQLIGARDDIDFRSFSRVTMPPYGRVDLSGAYDLALFGSNLPKVTVTARVENLLGAAYQEARHFPARGRTILAGARVRFGG